MCLHQLYCLQKQKSFDKNSFAFAKHQFYSPNMFCLNFCWTEHVEDSVVEPALLQTVHLRDSMDTVKKTSRVNAHQNLLQVQFMATRTH